MSERPNFLIGYTFEGSDRGKLATMEFGYAVAEEDENNLAMARQAADTLGNLLANISAAKIVEQRVSVVSVTAMTPVANTVHVESKALMSWLDANRFGLNFSIPAPKETIFLLDGDIVNPADANVAALVAQLIGSGYRNTKGDNYAEFVGGKATFRARRGSRS